MKPATQGAAMKTNLTKYTNRFGATIVGCQCHVRRNAGRPVDLDVRCLELKTSVERWHSFAFRSVVAEAPATAKDGGCQGCANAKGA